ncbi:hypothetical protein HX774_18795, partial [Brevundimonas sp. P7753]|nr:hypothetical protein [Brevundimonas sp. P7753]
MVKKRSSLEHRILAGPNGAGKTTFINGFLRERAEAFQFVNRDDAARLFFRHPPA